MPGRVCFALHALILAYARLQDLADRYGKPLIVLNLVKGAEKRPRESILQSEFANAVSYINKGVCYPPYRTWKILGDP